MTRIDWILFFVSVGVGVTVACTGTIGAPCSNADCIPSSEEPGGGPGGSVTASLLPVRVRRLTNAEFDASTAALLGTKQTFASVLSPDIRQSGYTRNAAAAIDDLAAISLQSAAQSLATEAVKNSLTTLAPCSSGTAQATCATTFIASFAARAYRRPLTSDDTSGLLSVYQTGAANPLNGDPAYASGIELVIETILQSPDFLYVTEIGGAAVAGKTQLSSYELASELSYLIVGGPPDDALMQAATTNALGTPDQLATQAKRLLALPAASIQLAAFIQQWLGIDATNGSVNGNVTRTTMVTATNAFVSAVFSGGGDLPELLTANYAYVDPTLAKLYGVAAPTGTDLTKATLDPTRIGILNQANFLSTYAHQSASSPTKRGHIVRSRMLCQAIPPPDPALKVNMTPPAPSGPIVTTRQAYEQHMVASQCSGCHKLMDGIGFGFENFDGTGAYRTTEGGQAIDDSGELDAAGDVTGTFANDAELLQKLAKSTNVSQCYQLNLFDFIAAQTDPSTDAAFTNFINAQPAAAKTNLPALIVAFVQSSLFSERSTP